jgi:hypothetical protein
MKGIDNKADEKCNAGERRGKEKRGGEWRGAEMREEKTRKKENESASLGTLPRR